MQLYPSGKDRTVTWPTQGSMFGDYQLIILVVKLVETYKCQVGSGHAVTSSDALIDVAASIKIVCPLCALVGCKSGIQKT